MLLYIYYTYTALSVHCHCVVPVVYGVNQSLPIRMYVWSQNIAHFAQRQAYISLTTAIDPTQIEATKKTTLWLGVEKLNLLTTFMNTSQYINRNCQIKSSTTPFKMFGNTVIYGLSVAWKLFEHETVELQGAH